MYRLGRPVVENFQKNELMYRRFCLRDVSNGVILPSALKFPKRGDNTGQSANRSLFSQAQDALWTDNRKMNGWGVYGFPVACLPKESVCSHTQRRFTFFPRHVPVRNNYAHSEVWCDDLPSKNSGYVLPTEIVKKEFRATIQKHSKTFIAPRV